MKPLSLVVTEKLSSETEHFDHVHAHREAHRGYCISTPLLRKGVLKTEVSSYFLIANLICNLYLTQLTGWKYKI